MILLVDSECPDQPAWVRGPVWAFDVRMCMALLNLLLRKNYTEPENKITPSWIEITVLVEIQKIKILTQFYYLSQMYPVSILRKSISGRHRPVRVADGPMTARCRFM